jgi:hypothetical protein
MNRPPSPRKPSWKDAAGAPPEKVARQWQKGAAEKPAGPSWWRGRTAKRLYAVGGLGAVAALIVLVILLLNPPRPMRLVLIGAHYEDNLAVPHNVPGWRGVKALEEWASKGDQIDSSKVIELGDDDDALVKPIGKSDVLKRRPNTLVVYVSAVGIVREDAPYLVRPNHLNGGKPYPAEELLDALARLPKSKKLLILDVTPTDACWSLGQFHQSFVRAVEERARARAVPNLVILSSAGMEERSWDSTGHGTSIFAHFVLEGLKGAAADDGGKTSGRVNALELSRYVRDKVEQWTWHNRSRVQRPTLLWGTEADAKDMQLVTHPGGYKPPELPDDPSLPTKELESAWKKCLDLRDAVPSPAVYTPQLWREYLDRLLRAEQLLRIGANAGDWRAKLAEIEERIVRARTLQGNSQRLTLVMPAAFAGTLPPDNKAWTSRMEKLLQQRIVEKLPYAEQQKKYQALRAELDDPKKGIQDIQERQRILLQWSRQVLAMIADDPQQHLAVGRQILSHFDDRLPPWRPAEAHFAVMLSPDAKATGLSGIRPIVAGDRWDLIKETLQVRLRAERAALGLNAEDKTRLAAYSEHALPWFRATIEQGDEQRRRGEDLLFTSYVESWKEASRSLDAADKVYQTAQKDAAKVRAALALLTGLMAELPSYTRWLAYRGGQETSPVKKVASFPEQDLLELWKDLHALDQELQPNEKTGQYTSPDELAKRADRIRGAFKSLRDKAEEIAAKEQAAAKHQDRWHEIEAILEVPFLPIEHRLKLLRAQRSSARTLESGTGKSATVSGLNKEQLYSDARREAQRQGRLALAVRGEQSPFAKTRNDIENAPPESWHRPLQRVGEAYAKAVEDAVKEAQKLTTGAAEVDLKLAGDNLRKAARLARQVDGYLVGEPYLTTSPAEELRKLELHELLCWQARRARLDFWAAEPGATEPDYFRPAAALFLRDALALVVDPTRKRPAGQKDPRKARYEAELALLETARPPVLISFGSEGERTEVLKGLEAAKPPVQVPSPKLYPTDERNVERTYELIASKGTPPGQPVRWVEHGKGFKRLDKTEDLQRPLASGERFPLSLEPEKKSDLPDRRHRVVSWFRGHRSVVETILEVQGRPDLQVTHLPPPPMARIAVRSSSRLYDNLVGPQTALSLVLDCSGSMNEPSTGGRTRWQNAILALRAVLEDLPEGARVSLYVFGAAQFKDELGKFGGIRLVWKSHEWDPRKLDTKMRQVERLTPKYGTPLIRTITMALKQFPEKFPGRRSLVVITDGGDSNFSPRDPRYKNLDDDLRRFKGETISGVLRRAFAQATGKAETEKEEAENRIQFHVIGFNVSKNDPDIDAHKAFVKAIRVVKGVYHDAGDPVQLRKLLRDSLLRLYFFVDSRAGVPVPGQPPQGNPITRLDTREDRHWVPLRRAGKFEVSIPSFRRGLWQSLEIEPGDALLLEVAGTTPKSGFRRTMYANLIAESQPGLARLAEKAKDSWLLAALENQQPTGERKLQMLLTLEKAQKITSPNQRVRIIRPDWTWFEVPRPQGEDFPIHLRVFSLPGYPAPAWSLHLPWPRERKLLKDGAPVAGAPPSAVRAWWIEEDRSEDRFVPVAGHQVLPDLKDLSALVDKPWRTDRIEHKVHIESIRLEEMRVEVEAGKPLQEKTCLVIRLRYPKPAGDGKQEPYYVRVPGWQGGQQHRFYNKVGKSTSIFWAEGPNSDIDKIRRLHLISVAECKEKALTRRPLDLGTPDQRSRPNPDE